ncbi:MAG: hypothetical protein QM802_11930 [Agriterribacter sp.]
MPTVAAYYFIVRSHCHNLALIGLNVNKKPLIQRFLSFYILLFSLLLVPNKIEDKSAYYINKNKVLMHGWMQDGDEANVFPSFRFIQYQHQCFSSWDKVEMKSFWSFLEKFHNHTCRMLFNQAGKSDKSGFGYTPMPIDLYLSLNLKTPSILR